MAKTFKQLKEAVGAKLIYPVINARSPADQEFADAHPVQVIPDPEGNKDDIFAASNIQKDTTVRANKWTGDDDQDDADAETGLDTAGTYHNGKIDVDEETLLEISKKLLGSYINKAADDAAAHEYKAGRKTNVPHPTGGGDSYEHMQKSKKRLAGIKVAVKKISEGVELTEEDLDYLCVAEEVITEDYKDVLKKHGFSRHGESFAKTNGGRIRVGEHGDWHHTTAHGERKTGKDHSSLDKHLGSLSEAIGHIEHGAFHRWLGKSEDAKITAADIKKGLAAGGHAAKMAEFAKASKHFVHEEQLDEISHTEGRDHLNATAYGVHKFGSDVDMENAHRHLTPENKKKLGAYVRSANYAAIDKKHGGEGSDERDRDVHKDYAKWHKQTYGTKHIPQTKSAKKLNEELETLEEALHGPYQNAYHEAKKVLHPMHHAAAAKAFASMESGEDERTSLRKHNLHHFSELHPILKKHNISESQLQELSKALLGRYIKKASKEADDHHNKANAAHANGDKAGTDFHDGKSVKRDNGIIRAANKWQDK
jgi:hypothetical protein